MKKILSILLCLCMVAVLLPTTALAATPVENVIFDYAYDAQRTPAFPTTGQTVTMSSLKRPVISGDIWNYQRGENSGSWTLTRFGTYSYVKSNNKNTPNLDSIVDSVADIDIYDNLDENTIVIHELKNGNDHIAYGVVLAYSETENMAMFVGDLWNSSGAFYLLSKDGINYNSNTIVSMRAEMVATHFVGQTASIALDPAEDYTFPAATEGYGEQTSLTVTVTKMGTVATGSLNITLSGDNAACFTVTPGTIENIGTDSNIGASFKVEPKTGLAAGTYTATVTVSGNNVDPRSINVSFTVTASPSTPVVIIVPDDTADTTDPAKNPETGDNSTHLLWAVMASSALCAAALLFSSRRRGEEMQ